MPTGWYRVLVRAWLETPVVAGALSLVLVLLGVAIPESPLPIYIGILLTATALLLALGYDAPVATWISSPLALATITYGLAQASDLAYPTPLLDIALLAHATLFLLAGFTLRMCADGGRVGGVNLLATADCQGVHTPRSPGRSRLERLDALWLTPFSQSALVSSFLALPLLVWNGSPLLAPSLGLFWLAGLWLGIAVVRRWPILFTAFQGVLSLAVVFAVAAWLENRDWFRAYPPDAIVCWFDPRSLHAFGLGLGCLSLAWVIARIGFRRYGPAQAFLEPGWPGVDRIVLVGLVAGQLVLAILGVLPGAGYELSGGRSLGEALSAWPAALQPLVSDAGAWTLLGLLAVVLLISMWERWSSAAVIGLVILGLSAPLLVAGEFEASRVTVPTLRWGLAGYFLVVSLALWVRTALDRLATQLRWSVSSGVLLPPIVRGALIAGTVGPVLLLSFLVAASDVAGALVQPDADTMFGRMPWLLAALGPLIGVSLGLGGHALRERSPAYAFGAGLAANLTVTGGQALAYLKSHGPLDAAMATQLAVLLVQWFTVTAAVWTIAWLGVRSWLVQPTSQRPSALAKPLLAVQLGFGAAGNAALIGLALWLMAAAFPATNAWVLEAGSPLGWLALITTAAAAVGLRCQQASILSLKMLGLIGLAAIGLLACSIERIEPGNGWGYRTLTLGWATYPLIWVVAVSDWFPRSAGQPQPAERTDAALFWIHVAGVLALLLSLKAGFGHLEQLWAAGAIALVSPAWGVAALWRKREGEAFLVGLGVNLAASLVVWHAHPGRLADWWVYLLQANVIAGSLVMLLWLGLARRLYRVSAWGILSAPFLFIQGVWLLIANAALLEVPVVLLLLQPEGLLPTGVLRVGEVWGWLALALTATATMWYFWRVVPLGVVHVVCGVGVGLGTLAACAVGQATGSAWLPYHLLAAMWTLTALAALGLGWAWSRKPPHGWPLPDILGAHLQPWIRGLGVLVVLLAMRAALAGDPDSPYWPASSALVVSVLFGALAFWSRRPLDVYGSGLLLNVVGTLVWSDWGDLGWPGFVFVQVLCLAIASAVWTTLQLGAEWLAAPVDVRGRWLPFPHLAITVAAGVLGVTVVWAVLCSVAGLEAWATGILAWAALGATAAALVLLLWDRTAAFPLGGLYAVGLMAIGLALHDARLAPRNFGWTASWILACYVSLTAAVGRQPRLGQALGLPRRQSGWSLAWFVPVQVGLAGLVAALSVWISLDFDTRPERLAGAFAVVLLLPAGVLLADRAATGLRLATLVLGVAAVTELGWALIEPAGHRAAWLWLHRNVHLMGVLAVLTVLYGVGLPRWLSPSAPWALAGRRLGPVLGLVASVLVGVILVQEAALFEGHRTLATLFSKMLRTPLPETLQAGGMWSAEPMAALGIGTVAVALQTLVGAALCFALLPGRDPLGLSERGRRWYVYAAEVLVVLLFVHFRLTIPGIFKHGFFTQYWPFVLMAIAFGGAGLSEFFHRRGVPVLAEPLERTGVFLPLLPVLAFWVLSPAGYALLCFLAGLLYGLLSVTKQSFRFALLAALAVNMGLWVLLHHNGIYFFDHPQFWLIPLALVILVAEHLNRDRLPAAQGAALRYLALMVIYISSAADMFIVGLGRSVAMPMVLAGLSVLGVLAGMLLRVRAFLFLGVTFLLVVILTLIWHAGVDRHQTWVLWSAGIVLGVAILTLFGIFEKRRNEVLHLMQELKQWD